MKLKNLLNEETFTAINKASGKTAVFKTKDSRDAAIKAGTHSEKDDEKPSSTGKKSSGVNIFDKPSKKQSKSSSTTSSDMGVDSVVYNKRTKTVGIVRLGDERGETKTDADGNVNTSELEPYNPMKYPHQKDAQVAPSTKKEIDSRGLWKPFAQSKDTSSDTPKVDPIKLTKLMPKADKEVFDNKSDINKIPDAKKKEISMKIDKLAELTKQAKEKGESAPNFNLCKITVPGTNLYCSGNEGIPREEMPQFKGTPEPGSPASKMPTDKSGEVDTEPVFKKMLADKGIKTLETEIPSDSLKATQSELVGSKVAGMAKALESNPNHDKITAPIYVSRDGYVVDGHHRWAAVTSNAIRDGRPSNMKVIVIDAPIKEIIPMANKFAEEIGIAPKKADANQEKPAEQPKQQRKGNPQVNKEAKKLADKFGLNPNKMSKEDYITKMYQATVSALTDSNFHQEARELVAKLEGKPEWAKKPEYPSIKDPKYKEKIEKLRQNSADGSIYMNGGGEVDDYGTEVSQASGWDGVDAADAIAFTLRMNGFHKQADMIQSIFDNKPYMKNEGRISLSNMVNEIETREGIDIAYLTGLRPLAVQKFIDDNNIDARKLLAYLKIKGPKTLSNRMDIATAIVGKPGNKFAQGIIKAFSK